MKKLWLVKSRSKVLKKIYLKRNIKEIMTKQSTIYKEYNDKVSSL